MKPRLPHGGYGDCVRGSRGKGGASSPPARWRSSDHGQGRVGALHASVPPPRRPALFLGRPPTRGAPFPTRGDSNGRRGPQTEQQARPKPTRGREEQAYDVSCGGERSEPGGSRATNRLSPCPQAGQRTRAWPVSCAEGARDSRRAPNGSMGGGRPGECSPLS